tara:strand:+ start:603 stop:1136 length:534 start_codon:yes stop_codon:yes gene_type:complete
MNPDYSKIQFMNDDLKYNITLLPKDIQAIIYIITWKGFWKTYVPLTAKPPSWLHYANYVKSELWNASLNNIHFLHLPFNTLPENKKWIMGCQCDSCISDTEVDFMEKHMHSLVQYRNPAYFTNHIAFNESVSSWNKYHVICAGNLLKVFDPLRGSYKENKFTKKLREGYKFEFTYIQ